MRRWALALSDVYQTKRFGANPRAHPRDLETVTANHFFAAFDLIINQPDDHDVLYRRPSIYRFLEPMAMP